MDSLTLTGFHKYLNKILGILLDNIDENVQIKRFEVADSSVGLNNII